jgi:dipeptide/tripeptide permease
MSFPQRLEDVRSGFDRPFWIANISEIFERLAYYGAFASLANYLRETLSFPTEQTGTLTGIFGGMVWFLAIFGGAVADKVGFRRALSLAYAILHRCAVVGTASLGGSAQFLCRGHSDFAGLGNFPGQTVRGGNDGPGLA